MHRRLIARFRGAVRLVAAVRLAAAASAFASLSPPFVLPARAEDVAGPGGGVAGGRVGAGYVRGTTYEMGARLGAQLAALGLTPGGLRVGGLFLYRFTETGWFDSELAFTFGAGGKECYLDRQRDFACDHGIADGFSLQLLAGVRHYLDRRPSGFEPFVRGGLAGHFSRFDDDEVTGVAIPLWVSAGGRFRVAEGVAVTGDVVFLAGPSFYDSGLGAEPYGAFLVQLGADLGL